MKRRVLILTAAAVFLTFAAGCGAVEAAPVVAERQLWWSTEVYYLTDDGSYLVPTEKKLPWSGDMAKEAVESLVEGNIVLEGTGLEPPIPEGTEIKLAVEDRSAYVDLAIPGAEDEKTVKGACDAAAETLLAFPGIDNVSVSVNGTKLYMELDLSAPYEEGEINALGEELEKSAVIPYVIEESGLIVPVTKYFEAEIDFGPDEILAELKNAPEGLVPIVPADTEISGVTVEEDTLYVDLTGSFEGISEIEATGITEALSAAFLKCFDGVKNAAFILNGEMLGGGICASSDLYVNKLPGYTLAGEIYNF